MNQTPEQPDSTQSHTPGQPAESQHPSGAKSDDATHDGAEANIGRFRIERQLGKGGFGNVYLAWDPKLHRSVAIKVPRWDRPLQIGARDRFLLEGRMLAKVNHPAVVTVHDVGTTDDGVPFVVMEFVEGRSLSELIRQRELNNDQIAKTMIQIASALQQAHKRGVTHRDLKPSNVIINQEHGVCLVDFGLALHDDVVPDESDPVEAIGTPSYMAPEQIRGENHLIDGRTDIWAFGVVMYAMLVGRLPFRGAGHRELMRAICYKSPRPPRQFDESVPRGLERICLRCLHKLMDERYQSMADVLDELEAWLDEQKSIQETADYQLAEPQLIRDLRSLANESDYAGDAVMAPQSGPSKSGSQRSAGTQRTSDTLADQIEIVPKGLRSFDQSDHEYFLHLLPGPSDRHGMPESIRFWLARLGHVDQVDDVPIGLIYGPSGCGKSSFVRAGLIPRLPDAVIPVYVDATADRLSLHIVERIHREVSEAPVDLPLAELLRQVRHGGFLRDGDKLLLILDQFEQWLNRSDDYAQHELTEALRQCDADRVQALLLIRDDFWMSASQFLKCLDRRIEDGKNAMSLPLFDERHARRVLEALGRAHGALPASDKPLESNQLRFIRQAVESLAQRGKVICVHLAVLAETAKSRDWSQLDLRSMGGWEGIGREFIAGVFNDPETPSYVKRHSAESWKILKALLPTAQTALKGHLVRRGELRSLSGLDGHNAVFDQLMGFLEFEAHLISPMEDEEAIEQDSGNSKRADVDQAFYGLTHDFLVQPIRAWGSAKQNETRRGRAESLLHQLAGQWGMTHDDRFLPSIWDFCRIGLFASRSSKRESSRYWKRAVGRYSVLATAVLLFATVGILMASLLNKANQSRFARNAADAFLNCPASELSDRWATVLQLFAGSKSRLEEAVTSDSVHQRIRANAALLAHTPEQLQYLDQLAELVSELSAEEFVTLGLASRPHAQLWIARLKERFATSTERPQRARLAIWIASLGDDELLNAALRLEPNPELRSELIIQLSQWPDDISSLVAELEGRISTVSGDTLSGFAQALAMKDVKSLPDAAVSKFVDFLSLLYREHPHAGAHYSAWSALSSWEKPIPLVDEAAVAGREWRTLKIPIAGSDHEHLEIPFALIRAGVYELGGGVETFQLNVPTGSVKSMVEQDYWIAVSEIRLNVFQEFVRQRRAVDEIVAAMADREGFVNANSNDDPNAVVRGINWREAILFCNWLNETLGYQPIYQLQPDGRFLADESRPGIRLPTFDEFELATRCGSTTRFYFGDEPRYLSYFLSDSRDGLGGGQRRYSIPNGWGCFDMVSGGMEWVGDAFMWELGGMAAVKSSYLGEAVGTHASSFHTIFPLTAEFDRLGLRIVLLE